MSNPHSLRGPARRRPGLRSSRRVLRRTTVFTRQAMVVTSFVAVLASLAPATAVPKVGQGSRGVVPYSASLTRAPFGQIDALITNASGTWITGWAIDPDAPSPIIVDVTVDGRALPAVTANRARPDIAQVYSGYGSTHGFAAHVVLPSGRHTACVTARNVNSGPDRSSLGCRTSITAAGPVGAITWSGMTYDGLRVQGWAADPDSAAPLSVSVSVDGRLKSTVIANRPSPASTRSSPALGGSRGFDVSVIQIGAGAHRVCVGATNIGPGSAAPALSCASVTVDFSPVGVFNAIPRPAGSTSITVTGWAADPDQIATAGKINPIAVTVTLDGKPQRTLAAGLPYKGLVGPFSWGGSAHGFTATYPVNNAAHTVCLLAKSITRGPDRSLGCRTSSAMTATAPSTPRHPFVQNGTGQARVSWWPSVSNGGAPIVGYLITPSSGGRTVAVKPNVTNVLMTSLPSVPTTFSVRARNVIGNSAPAVSPQVTPKASPFSPQRTPPLITTSRYIRNITGDNASDRRVAFAMGATDAAHNPSGHRYLILLQIGGQTTSGVVLSATSRFVSYRNTLIAMQAYLDGYHSRQGYNAPVTIAIGTNNDIDVRYATGALWATQLVNPLYSYARRYGLMTIAGANDIEPGFIGTPTASQSWVSGFLNSSPAQFVFNGSADGCSWTQANSRCNNGWNSTVLQWLSGGAAPTRILSLPQIYNHTMSKQWKYISLTGVLARHPRINFAGPLTEWTACYAQGYGCGSLQNREAWSTLWSDLNSDSRVALPGLPYGTDLRVN